MADEIRYPVALPQAASQAPAQPSGNPHLAAILDQALAARYAASQQQIQAQQFAPMWQLATVAASGIVLGAAGCWVVVGGPATPIVQQVPQIQVVQQDKAVVVDRGCIAFCGK